LETTPLPVLEDMTTISLLTVGWTTVIATVSVVLWAVYSFVKEDKSKIY